MDDFLLMMMLMSSDSNQDTFVNENGYECFSDSGEFVHRVVAAEKLGRDLYPGEVVHHIDRDKLNNSPENLWVFKNQEEHDRVHRIDAERYGASYSYRGISEEDEDDFDDDFYDEDDFDDFDDDF